MAVPEMIELLANRYNYSPIDAYMLCSLCADLRISSIVDVPNWVCRSTSRVWCWTRTRRTVSAFAAPRLNVFF
jgi:hypothetical protein